MKSTIVAAVAVAASVLIGGCASHSWAPGPDAKGTYDEASAQCSLAARHSGGEFYAQGNAKFVAGATLGYALGDAIRAQNDFNDCMKANGWVVADNDPQSVARAQAAQAQAAAIGNQMKSCLETARNNPKYASLVPHLESLAVGHYTLTQMADNRVPTAQEATLLAAYGDDSQICRDTAATQITAIDPRAGQAFQNLTATIMNLDLALINRQMSWGAYAQQAQGIVDAASGHPGVTTASYSPPPPPPMPASTSPRAQTAQAGTTPSASAVRPCTQAEATQKRIAIENGYTSIPNCN